MQTAIDDDLHHAERQRRIGTRARLDVPVGERGGACHPRVDGDDLRAVGARLVHEWHRVHAGGHQIGTPQDHDIHARQVFDVGIPNPAGGEHFRRGAGCSADGALQAARAHAVEEPLAHSQKTEQAKRA